MFKPICLLLTGLLAAGNLFGQTDASKSPAAVSKDPAVATTAVETTVRDPDKTGRRAEPAARDSG